FFFQAEDGIRDYKVTGVQTCALPISSSASSDPTKPKMVDAQTPAGLELRPVHSLRTWGVAGITLDIVPVTSPEKSSACDQLPAGVGLGDGVPVGGGGGVSAFGDCTSWQTATRWMARRMSDRRMRGRGLC